MVNGHWLNSGNNDVYINNGDGTFKTISNVFKKVCKNILDKNS